MVEIALLLAANYAPWANALLSTLPVPGAVWLLLVPFALGILALEELRKALVRRRHARAAAGRIRTR